MPHTKILFVGDMHLGKRPYIPSLETSNLSATNLGPRVAWEEVVRVAISEKVDAVALAGDLVDSDKDLFEGRTLLEKEINKLTEAGIVVCAVAGNHDTHILPQLADSIASLQLLGSGGTWSDYLVTGQGADVRLVGWSFPANHHSTSPLASTPPATIAGVITLGLLHCDLGAKRSRYAPVSARELQATGYQAWFLGHVHQPGIVPDFSSLPATPFYLGSITGTDRNETGIHGPVLVTVAHDGTIEGRRIPTAPLHWDHLELPVGSLFPGMEGERWETTLRNHLMAAMDTLPQWQNQELAHIKALGLSITLTGKVAEPHRVTRTMENVLEKPQHGDDPLAFPVNGKTVFIQKLNSAVTGLVNLEELASQQDPPGLLARQILVLKNPEGPFDWSSDPATDARQLIALGRKQLQRVAREASAGSFLPDHPDPDDAAISLMMVRTGSQLLDGLLEQERSAHASS